MKKQFSVLTLVMLYATSISCMTQYQKQFKWRFKIINNQDIEKDMLNIYNISHDNDVVSIQLPCINTMLQNKTNSCETFEGTIQIDQHEQAVYLASNYHQFFQEATGLRAYNNDPYIDITVILQISRKQFGGEGNISVNWTRTPLADLKYYENNTNLQEKFPPLIPAAYLYNKKAGDIINFLIYGHSVKLTCLNNFKEDFEKKINDFQKKATYTTIFNKYPRQKNGIENYLIEHKILDNTNHAKHGSKGYNFDQSYVELDILRHKDNVPYNITKALMSRELTGSFKK